MQNYCNSTYNSLAPRKIFEHINELWCRTIVSQKCNGNLRTDNNNRQISHVMRKPMFYISRNKCTDQLHTNKEADQHLYFHYSDSNFQYSDSTIPLLSISKIYSIKAIFCSRAAWFVWDMVENYNIGFLMMGLKCSS